jgi:DNA-binding LacI/PurR family transcriptional regulator
MSKVLKRISKRIKPETREKVRKFLEELEEKQLKKFTN